jgi:hypothetical protein
MVVSTILLSLHKTVPDGTEYGKIKALPEADT